MTEKQTDQIEDEIEETVEEVFEEEIEEDFGHEDGDSEADETARVGGLGLSRSNLILAALAVIQVLVAGFMLWPRGGRAVSNEPLLTGLGVSAAAEADAESADAAFTMSDSLSNIALTDDTGNSITLERSGSEWVLAGTDGYPVKADSVSSVIEKLADANTDRLVTNTSSSHERLQVAADDFVRKIDLTAGDGTQTLYVGSSPASNATHVRLDGRDETYLAGGINSWELAATASNWIETNYYQATATDVTEITLENANGTFTFTRPAPPAADATDASPRDWSLFGLGLEEELNQSAITSLVSQATNIRLTTPLGKSAQPAYGIDAPQATVMLKTETADGATDSATLTIGAQAENSTDYALKSSESEYFVQVSSFNGEQFVNKTRGDFVTVVEPGEAAEEEASE